MTTEITNRVLEQQVKRAKVELDTHDEIISRHVQKLAFQQVERQKVLDQIAALTGDFPELQRVVDEHDNAKLPPPAPSPAEPLLTTAKVRR